MHDRQPGRPMSPSELRLRQKMREKRRKQRQKQRLCLLAAILVAIIGIIFLITKLVGTLTDKPSSSSRVQGQSQSISQSQSESAPQSQQSSQPQSESASQVQNIDVSSTTNTSDWRMILANKNTPLPQDYTIELATLADSSLQMQAEAAAAFDQMREAANAAGLKLMACSAYRSVERQTELYNAEVQKWLNQGYTQEDAEAKAVTVVMIPGCSEHNTGLAVDVGSVSNQRVELDFEGEPEFEWLQQHAAEYGFILRYPEDKQAITGVTYEPWHYRYVGVDNAKAIKESGLCLEEYLTNLS